MRSQLVASVILAATLCGPAVAQQQPDPAAVSQDSAPMPPQMPQPGSQQGADPTAPVGPWLAVARGTVDVEGGLMRLAAQREGLIGKVFVTEGDHVEAGQLLARLEDGAAQLQATIAEVEVKQAEASLAQAELRLRHAEAERTRLAPLLKADAVPARQGDEAARAAELAAAERQNVEIALALSRLRLDNARLDLDARAIKSPVAGVILRSSARPGDATTTATVTEMFLLAPDGQRVMRATLDEQFVGKVAPGQRAQIISERDTAKTFEGSVLRIAPVFGRPGQAQSDARTVEIVITLEGDEAARLILGERLVARILP